MVGEGREDMYAEPLHAENAHVHIASIQVAHNSNYTTIYLPNFLNIPVIQWIEQRYTRKVEVQVWNYNSLS